ncbi:hypothetical protein [Luteimonas kalidii]|uniref:Uncharacterized protein n=1 Tax=Luteimonas kalidii TaxID=3042025 RepID=A0ABT6JW73_9GAMM|nr:hypothetical protein [Luteimonas kalidii]MDH5834827.1 hypothetical protein [Luteimonas kalidii]
MERLGTVLFLAAILIVPDSVHGTPPGESETGRTAKDESRSIAERVAARAGDVPAAQSIDRFPSQLFGTWDLGPRPCRLPVNEDSDSPIRIEAELIQGYEHFETPVRVERISDMPTAWRITTSETYLGSQVTDDVRIFVADGDRLVITSGAETQQYRKCQ